jgi:tetratricopeptide (TPR) repeat protein
MPDDRVCAIQDGIVSILVVLFLSAAPAAQSADVSARTRAAAQAMTDRRFDEAAAIYRDLLKILPDDPDILVNLGMALVKGRHQADALAPLERAIALNGELLRAQALLGSSYLALGEPGKLALAAFKRLDTLPDGPERRAFRATRARAEERYTDAVAELKAALALAPGAPALVFELASAYYAARDYEQTLATLSPLLQARPDDARLLGLAGHSLLQLRRPEEALPLLQRAVERDPVDPAARLALGRAYFQNGDFAAAIRLIEPQLASDEDGSLHVQLARAYAGLGKRDESVALLNRSQEIQRAAEDRQTAARQRTITAPK